MELRKSTGVDEVDTAIIDLVQRSDAHGDGRISLEDFISAAEVRQALFENASHEKRAKTPAMTRTVRTASSYNSYDPVNTLRQNLLQNQRHAETLKRTFAKYRSIDPTQLQRILMPLAKTIPDGHKAVQALVMSCKRDRCGMISYREFVRASRLRSENVREGRPQSRRAAPPVAAPCTLAMAWAAVDDNKGSDNMLNRIRQELKFKIGMKKLRKVFVQCDLRCAGAAEVPALRRMLLRLGLKSGTEAVDLFLQYCNARGDGEVTYSDFMNVVQG